MAPCPKCFVTIRLPGADFAVVNDMTEEIFDVVNAQDEVVGQATRVEVHAQGLIHRAVHVLVFNARGAVFLQKRSMTKDKSPGLWDSSASGHVDSGEDYDRCAARELQEELGLVVNPAPVKLFKMNACAETDQEHVWVYRCDSDGPFELNRDEIERGEWCALDDVTERIGSESGRYSGAFRALWKQFISR